LNNAFPNDDEPLLDDELLPDDDEAAPAAPQSVPQTRFAARPAGPVGKAWKVLIVDDDRDVRLVSELALRGLAVDDRPVSLLFAANAAEARVLLADHDDIAVALVDVVMESQQAGLELVRWIRGELGNWWVRLVVRTGEPGSAPEARVMADHELHDYLAKSETTARRLVSCVTGALRAWRDQHIIRLQRSGLQNVLQAVDGLFANRELDTLLASVLRETSTLISPPAEAAWLIESLGVSTPDSRRLGREVVCHATLDGTSPPEGILGAELPEAGRAIVRPDHLVYRFDIDGDSRLVIALRRADISPWECQIVELYGHAVALSLRHRTAWDSALSSITRALEEREVMLREIHHRVKNNLQITASLLSLQADGCLSPEARGALVDSVARVRSMALVHQQLYAGRDLARVSLDEFCRTLATLLRASLAPDAILELELEPATVSIDQGIPCGLILNELLTNALKHGRSEDGRVRIHLAVSEDDTHVTLVTRDEGPGLPGTIDEISMESLGLQMVESLARQLQAALSCDNAPGARFTLRIPRGARPA
jgi:two-component sensor histidine kinase/CheY-like chemotaxis protein